MRSLDKLLATTVLAAGMTLVAGGMAFAQTAPSNPTTQQMIDQLKPHTRGLIIGGSSAPPPAPAPATPETRGLIVGGGTPPAPATTSTVPPASTGMAPPVAPARPYTPPVAAVAPSAPAPMATPSRPVAPPATVMATPAAKPSLNLRVLFAFNSADLTPEAKTTLDNLGRALQSNDLKNSRFEVAGHTDAVGDDMMNRKLSEDRAAAVKNYLVGTYGIDAGRIQSVGYGKADLFDPAHPTSPINRRVQVTNLSAAG